MGNAPLLGREPQVFFMYAFWHVVSPVFSFRGRSVASVKKPKRTFVFVWKKPRKTLGPGWDQRKLVAFAVFLCVFWCGVSPSFSFSWQVCRVCEETRTNVWSRVEKTQKNPWSRVGPTEKFVAFSVFSCRVGWGESIFNVGSGLDYHD